LLDLRNHGISDHHDDFTFNAISEDIERHMRKKNVDKFVLLGFSLGGKVAMEFATLFPKMLDAVIIVDVPAKAPSDLPGFRNIGDYIFKKLKNFDVTGKTREEAIIDLNDLFPSKKEADFIAFNLMEDDKETKTVRWRSNVKVLLEKEDYVVNHATMGEYGGPVLILLGEKSPKDDLESYQKLFPNISKEDIKVIKNAGHYMQTENPEDTIKEISEFLSRLK